MEQACESSPETSQWKGRAALRNELHAFWFGDNSDSSWMGEQRGGREREWREASTSREMILLLSTHPMMISAHASIHVDALKIWKLMMQRSTLSLFFGLSHWLALSFASSLSLSLIPLSLPVSHFLCNFLPQGCSPIPISYIPRLFIWAHLLQWFHGMGWTAGAAGGHRCPPAYPLYRPRRAHVREQPSVLHFGN